jgi:hypothetical protein
MPALLEAIHASLCGHSVIASLADVVGTSRSAQLRRLSLPFEERQSRDEHRQRVILCLQRHRAAETRLPP